MKNDNIASSLLKYDAYMTTLLKDDDEKRLAYNRLTMNLSKDIKKDRSDKCFYSFLVGAIVTTMLFAGGFYVTYKKNNIEFDYQIESFENE